MQTMRLTLKFGSPGYIANPYWPEMYHLIEIQKKSGMNRAKSDKNRRKALDEYLTGKGMSYDDYLKLEALSKRPFHHQNGDGSPIVIPTMQACLVNGASIARAATRIATPETVRTVARASAFVTDKTEPDGVWERFVVVQSSSGKLSNQRGLRQSPYIEDFTATGTVEYDDTFVEPGALLKFVEYCGREVGVGASRKMGWGRFSVVDAGDEVT